MLDENPENLDNLEFSKEINNQQSLNNNSESESEPESESVPESNSNSKSKSKSKSNSNNKDKDRDKEYYKLNKDKDKDKELEKELDKDIIKFDLSRKKEKKDITNTDFICFKKKGDGNDKENKSKEYKKIKIN
jgi:hypothetical protein